MPRPARNAPMHPREAPWTRDGAPHGPPYKVECPACDSYGFAVLWTYAPPAPVGFQLLQLRSTAKREAVWECRVCGATWLSREWILCAGGRA